jgi:putative transposase
LGLARSSYNYCPRHPAGESEENLRLMRLLDEQYTKTPFYGVEKLTVWLRLQGELVNPKRVRRLLRKMGLMAIYPKPNLSQPHPDHKIYPYLLRGVKIERVNQVWSTDITYIRTKHGFIYLVAIIDWYSRYVLAWEVSNSLDTSFCLSCLDMALGKAKPEIFNTDQGSQFTSLAFTGQLEAFGIQISMDGRGRALDNIWVERLWRTVKQEEVYLHDYTAVNEAIQSLKAYFQFYNQERFHQALNYATPAQIFFRQG